MASNKKRRKLKAKRNKRNKKKEKYMFNRHPFKKTCEEIIASVKERGPVVYISPLAHAEMQYVIKANSSKNVEISWFGAARIEDTGDIFLEKIFVPTSQTCCAASTNLEGDEVKSIAREVLRSGYKLSEILFWGHVHPGTSTSPSSQDNTQMMEFGTNHGAKKFLRAICSHDGGRIEFTYYDFENNKKYADIPWSKSSFVVEIGEAEEITDSETGEKTIKRDELIVTGIELGTERKAELQKQVSSVKLRSYTNYYTNNIGYGVETGYKRISKNVAGYIDRYANNKKAASNFTESDKKIQQELGAQEVESEWEGDKKAERNILRTAGTCKASYDGKVCRGQKVYHGVRKAGKDGKDTYGLIECELCGAKESISLNPVFAGHIETALLKTYEEEPKITQEQDNTVEVEQKDGNKIDIET